MRLVRLLVTTALAISLGACGGGGGGGGGDSSNGDLSTDRCSALGLNTRIIHGSACDTTNSPVVNISLVFSNASTGSCTGTMITSTQVLSAGHCFPSNTQSAFITVGGQRIDGVRFFRHPGYTPTSTALFKDVAILELERSPNLPTVAITTSHALADGDKIAIFGYGLTESGSAGELRSGEMLAQTITADHIIATYDGNGSNTCSGDSGGPAILQSGGKVGIVGITSSGAIASCGVGDTSLFANAQSAAYLNFIKSVAPNVVVN